MGEKIDLVIVGAGPAGMAAAVEAAGHKLSVLVLDEQPEEGGQIYRSVSTTERLRPESYTLLGDDYQKGKKLQFSFQQTGVKYLSNAIVWNIEPDMTVNYLHNGSTHQVAASRLLIATGAQERPVPIPGWTLPGVMGAAAADVLLKSSGVVPSGKIVLVGSGPLLWLAASRLAEAKAEISAVLETVNFSNYLKALPHLPLALPSAGYLLKGLRMKSLVCKARIEVISGVTDLRAEGTEELQNLHFKHRKKYKIIEVDTLLLHEGVVPNIQLSSHMGCEHDWNELQNYWHPVLDEWGNTSIDGVAVAGDSGIVAGAQVAEASGHLAGLEASYQLGRISKNQRDEDAAIFRRKIKHHNAVRPFLEHLYSPNQAIHVPKNNSTLICRCEEVTAGQIRKSVELGALDLNGAKAYTRCGMGPCQGRMCGLAAAGIIAEVLGKSPRDVGYFRCRAPVKPINLAQLTEAGNETSVS